MKSPERILVLQLRRLGDVLLTTPLVRALHHLFPQASIDFLTVPSNHVVLAGNPHLRRAWSYPPRASFIRVLALAGTLRRERYDLSVDTLGDPGSALIGWLAAARVRVGFDVRAPRRWSYTRVVVRDPSKYTVDRKLDLVRWMGEVPGDLRPDYAIPEPARAEAARFWVEHGLEGRPVVALSPVSRRVAKRWDPRAFAEVADRLGGEGAAVLLLWGPGEESQVGEVARAMRSPFVMEAPPPPVPLLAAQLERASVLVGNDNGMKHLALAVGTPTVTVHTVSRASSWNPPGDPRHVAFEQAVGSRSVRPSDIAEAALSAIRLPRR